jgi:hypothetical protein
MDQKAIKRSPKEEHSDSMLLLYWMLFIMLGVGVWIATSGLRLSITQGIVLTLWLVLPFAYLITVCSYHLSLGRKLAKQWPKPMLYVPKGLGKKALREANEKGSTLLGFEDDRTPVYWTTGQRSLQGNLPGQSGAGKTTFILNIVEQDIKRGHPVIYFDGKGDKELILKIWNLAFAAGRGADVRVIDPSNPSTSAKFNPFYTADGQIQQRVGTIFDSLGAADTNDKFFSEHQRAFLNAITAILEHTGKQFSFLDVLVACQNQALMLELIGSLREKVLSDPDMPQHKKNSFNLNVITLVGNYQDKDWLKQIRGLLNSMMPFVGDTLALITGSAEDLVTFEEVSAKKQILIISMNLGTDSQPIKGLGRIMMRNLQFMIASRYNEYKMNVEHPFLSIVMDEFGMYAYKGFKEIIHTARQANAAFLFSFQSNEQLAMDVGPAFSSDVAAAPGSKFMMRISDNATAEAFLKASATVLTQRISERVEKGGTLEHDYLGEGSGTRQEVLATRVSDEQIRVLPTGQMMALLPEHAKALVVKHLHVRAGNHAELDSVPQWLPVLKTPKSDSDALNLQVGGGDFVQPSTGTSKRRQSNAKR